MGVEAVTATVPGMAPLPVLVMAIFCLVSPFFVDDAFLVDVATNFFFLDALRREMLLLRTPALAGPAPPSLFACPRPLRAHEGCSFSGPAVLSAEAHVLVVIGIPEPIVHHTVHHLAGYERATSEDACARSNSHLSCPCAFHLLRLGDSTGSANFIEGKDKC